jgi:flavin reductase (DIM6/NTAB) family NADH-FMN oxidoreductase RutF
MLGLGQMGRTSDTLVRSREGVINLPSDDLVTHVDRLALTTGRDPVPDKEVQWAIVMSRTNSASLGLLQWSRYAVKPPRVAECPVQIEGMVHEFRSVGKNVNASVFEVHIVKLRVDEKLLVGDETRPHIDPVRWCPLIMNFCRFFGLTAELHASRLAESNFRRLASQGGAPRPKRASTAR